MTFAEFKEIATNPKYPDENVIYRADIYDKGKTECQRNIKSGIEITLKNSYIAPNFKGVEHIIKKSIRCDIPKTHKRLFAIYIYELPFYKKIQNNNYRRLWVYNNKGCLISQSVCSSLIEDFSTTCTKFMGRLPEQIAFKPGEIVEFFDRNLSKIYLGLVVESPFSIEQCWEIQERIKKECIIKGLMNHSATDNIFFNIEDKYTLFTLDGTQKSVKPTDVFPLSEIISDDIKENFDIKNLRKEKFKEQTQQVNDFIKDYIKHLDEFSNLLNLL